MDSNKWHAESRKIYQMCLDWCESPSSLQVPSRGHSRWIAFSRLGSIKSIFLWPLDYSFFKFWNSPAAGRHSQAGPSAAAAERHQRGSEEPAAPHALQPPARQTQGQTLLTAVLQPPQVVWLPKPYDARLKQVCVPCIQISGYNTSTNWAWLPVITLEYEFMLTIC